MLILSLEHSVCVCVCVRVVTAAAPKIPNFAHYWAEALSAMVALC